MAQPLIRKTAILFQIEFLILEKHPPDQKVLYYCHPSELIFVEMLLFHYSFSFSLDSLLSLFFRGETDKVTL